MEFDRRMLGSVFLRLFAIQGSWNYQTMIGGGLGFSLMPVLRKLHPDSAELRMAVARHAHVFNSHPYLAGVAAGSLSRMESEGEDPETVERFKAALRGSLGSLGDQLFWAGWRPVCLLLALVLLALGLYWWIVVVAFLAIYNTGHLGVRWWAFRVGLDEAKSVGERLRASVLPRFQPRLGRAGALLAGILVPLAAGGALTGVALPSGWIVVGMVAGLAGARYAIRARRTVLLGLAAVLFLALIPGA